MNVLDQLPSVFKDIYLGTGPGSKKRNGHQYTLAERRGIIARRLRVHESSLSLPITEADKAEVFSGIGDRLKEIIKRERESVPCGPCKEEIKRLNGMTAAGVLSERKELADKIIARGRESKLAWYDALAVRLPNWLVRPTVIKWIEEACQHTMTWAYGITTVVQRKDDLLPRTVLSLRAAGFDQPTLFVDGEESGYESFGLPVTYRRPPRVRAFWNWYLSLAELYGRSPLADRYAIFQDDMVACLGLREYLNNSPYPEQGYLNLYTFPVNQALCGDKPGWYVADQTGQGGVALVFSNEAARELIASRYMVDRPMDPDRGHRALDGGIVDAFEKVGWREYVHNPSLVQHTGMKSTMNNGRHPTAPSFRGEQWDARELLS
jgi:hypothetical protein